MHCFVPLTVSMFLFFWCIFLKWQKQRLETEAENVQAGNDPPVTGAFPGVVFLPASHSYTAITFQCVTMISTSRYVWGQMGFWHRTGNVRKALTGNLCSRLCAISQTLCKVVYLSILTYRTVERLKHLTEITTVGVFLFGKPKAICCMFLWVLLPLLHFQVGAL